MAAWGGSQAVAESVAPVATRRGAYIASRKRASTHRLSRSNPGSDHNTANRNAYAIDFGTYRGAPIAHALASALGIRGYRTGTYTGYNIRRGGATFRVQILWAVQGHYDHVHLGLRKVAGTYKGTKKRDPYRSLTKRERRWAERLDYHQRERAREARTGKGKRYRRQDKWVGYWAKKVRRHMAALAKDAKKSGWKKDNRGARYQALKRSLNR